MAVGDTSVSWLSHTSTNTILSKATDYFSHMFQKWEVKICRKESLLQPGIKVTTTRSSDRHAHHWATGLAQDMNGNNVEIIFNPFPNKPWFYSGYSTGLLKTLWEKKKLLETSNFFFSHSVFCPFEELSAIFIKVKIIVCKLSLFGRV